MRMAEVKYGDFFSLDGRIYMKTEEVNGLNCVLVMSDNSMFKPGFMSMINPRLYVEKVDASFTTTNNTDIVYINYNEEKNRIT